MNVETKYLNRFLRSVKSLYAYNKLPFGPLVIEAPKETTKHQTYWIGGKQIGKQDQQS